ncbi:MAG: protein disulfide oxidoreductase [Candidatus Micrarchaeia archaeon]
MAIIGEKDVAYLRDLFSKKLKNDVNLVLFTSNDGDCQLCDKNLELMNEIAKLSDKIKLKTYDIHANEKEAKFLGVDKAPALVLGGKKLYNAYYFGMPYGHEFSALVNDIIEASTGETSLKKETKEKIKAVNKKLDIKVFVTPTCPYCPMAVHMAHQFAMENDNVKGEMIEAMEFPELADKYGVMAVPKIVINDSVQFEGAVPEEMFLEYINKAVEES